MNKPTFDVYKNNKLVLNCDLDDLTLYFDMELAYNKQSEEYKVVIVNE